MTRNPPDNLYPQKDGKIDLKVSRTDTFGIDRYQ